MDSCLRCKKLKNHRFRKSLFFNLHAAKKGATQRPLLALPLSGSPVDLDREVVDALGETVLDFGPML